MIARLGAIVFVLLTFAFVVAAIIYGNSDGGGDAEAIRQNERMTDFLRAAAFCSFVCALFFGAMAELKRELEGIHTTLVLQRTSTSQSPPDAPVAATTVIAAAPVHPIMHYAAPAPAAPPAVHAPVSLANLGNGPQHPANHREATVAGPPGDGAVVVTPHLQRWFVAGRDAAGHPHTAYIDAEDRDSAFAAAISRGLKDVTTIEPR